MITNFFTDLNGEFKADEFEHPDPTMKKKKVNFCDYWEESWKFDKTQVMDNPAPQSGAKAQAENHGPIGWIAANYPHNGDFLDEFKLLQKIINNPAKNNVSQRRTLNTYSVSYFCDSRCLILRRRFTNPKRWLS